MFVETEEQTLLRHAVDRFFRDSSDAGLRAWSPDEWRRLASELGVLAAAFPEELGGAGGGFGDAMIVMELLGEHLLVRPYLECVIMAGRVIAASSHPRRGELIRSISEGHMIIVPAWRESGSGENPAAIALCAKADGEGGHSLSGAKIMVRAAPWATHILVAARISGEPRDRAGIALFLVPTNAPGLDMRRAETIDGHACADLALDKVQVGADAMIVGPQGGYAALTQMLAEATVAVCAEAVGVMRSLIDQTVTYTRQRKQFGQTLASFQILQHRMVDMRIAAEQATSIARAAAAVGTDLSADTEVMVSAAKYVVNRALDTIGRSAVQIHGAIGLMQETPVSWYFKRSVVLKQQFGSGAHHLDILAAHAGSSITSSADEDASSRSFRDEVRAFLSEALTSDLSEKNGWETGAFAKPEISIPWQKVLAARGWAAPGWPVDYGGPGWTPRQRKIFEEELVHAGAPRPPAMGLQMVAPVLMRFGTAEQKARFLPPMLSADEYWCQGYSEPQAGSDLAALQLQALRDGDDYVLNGTKIWTTFAQYADWIFVLARTKPSERKQDGISFILVPMTAAGLTVRPLISMSGEHEVNQLFFDDVRVPVTNLVGEENDGWRVAKYLLEFERGVGHQVPTLIHELVRLRELALTQMGEASATLWDEEQFRRRYADLEARTLAIRLTEERLVYSLPAGQNIGDATAAMMKLGWSEMGHEIAELLVEAAGPYAMVNQEPAFTARDPAKVFGPPQVRTVIRRYLDDRVLTVAGGSSEVLRTILARQMFR